MSILCPDLSHRLPWAPLLLHLPPQIPPAHFQDTHQTGMRQPVKHVCACHVPSTGPHTGPQQWTRHTQMCSPEAYDLAQVLLKLVQLPIHLPDHTVNPLFTSVSSKLHTMPNPEEIRNKSVVNECFSKSVYLSKHSCKPVQSGVTLNWKVFRKDFWWRPFYFFLWWGQSQARPLGGMCVGEVRSKAPRARLTITS